MRYFLLHVSQRFSNGPAAAAFPHALDLLDEVGLARVQQHETELTGRALDCLASIPDLTVVGPLDPYRRGGLVAFQDPRVHPHEMAAFLDAGGFAIRSGHHCAQPLHRLLGVTGTVRASLGLYSSRADIDAFLEAVKQAREFY